jgi:hypothetical protein
MLQHKLDDFGYHVQRRDGRSASLQFLADDIENGGGVGGIAGDPSNTRTQTGEGRELLGNGVGGIDGRFPQQVLCPVWYLVGL